MRRRHLLSLSAAGLAMPAVSRAQSAAWPDRPLHLIVPFPLGGSTDTIARIIQSKLSEALGKQVVID
jgi:tripartite-type tricarboxylate transporter receptor subunit TctC